MTKRQWIIIGILFAAVVVMFCCGGVFVLSIFSPSRQQVVMGVVTTTPLMPTDTPTPRPTPTLAVLNMSIDDIEHCCKGMTTVQENQYLATLVGQRVNWQGTVDDVKTDGTIWVRVSSTRIEMNGAPPEIATKVNKGQVINFYAIITKAANSFLVPGVQLRFESLNANISMASMTPTLTTTALSTPIPTPASLFSAAEQQYMNSTGEIMEPYFAATDQISRLLQKVSNNILLIRDRSWQNEMLLNMAIVKTQGEKFRKLVPPARLVPVHTDMVNATQHLDKAIDLIAAGIDGLDASKFDQAAQEVNKANALVNSATQKGYALMTPPAPTNTVKPTITRTPTRVMTAAPKATAPK